MTPIARKLGEYRKAVATLVTGVYAWAGLVVFSSTDAITSAEWYGLAGVVVATLAVAGITNEEPSDHQEVPPERHV